MSPPGQRGREPQDEIAPDQDGYRDHDDDQPGDRCSGIPGAAADQGNDDAG